MHKAERTFTGAQRCWLPSLGFQPPEPEPWEMNVCSVRHPPPPHNGFPSSLGQLRQEAGVGHPLPQHTSFHTYVRTLPLLSRLGVDWALVSPAPQCVTGVSNFFFTLQCLCHVQSSPSRIPQSSYLNKYINKPYILSEFRALC